MVYQGATGLYHFLIDIIPFISNCVLFILVTCEIINLFRTLLKYSTF